MNEHNAPNHSLAADRKKTVPTEEPVVPYHNHA